MRRNKWSTKKLGEICEVIAGQSPEGRFYNKSGNGLPFYQGKKEFTGKFIGAPITWTTKVTKMALKDDILMSVRAPVGPVNFATEKICIGRGLAAIRVTGKINKDFLFHFLQSFENEIVGNLGAVFNSINRNQIEEIKIPLPPIAEQRKIVGKIEKLFAKIDEASRLRAEASASSAALLPSALHQVFSCAEKEKWETRELIEVCEELFAGGDVPKDFSKTRNNNYRIPIFSNGIGKKSLYGFTRKARVNQECVTISARGTIGYPEIREEPFYPAIRLVVAVPKPSVIDVRFLKYVLETIGVQGTGNTIPQLTVPMIKNKKIPLPSIAEQKKIVAYLDALSAKTRELQNLQSQTAADLVALKQSILYQSFSKKCGIL